MIEVVVAPEARDDLLAILTYLAKVAGIETATRWHARPVGYRRYR